MEKDLDQYSNEVHVPAFLNFKLQQATAPFADQGHCSSAVHTSGITRGFLPHSHKNINTHTGGRQILPPTLAAAILQS
jgi:hypothetical protein